MSALSRHAVVISSFMQIISLFHVAVRKLCLMFSPVTESREYEYSVH
jgi:hypothetical protein